MDIHTIATISLTLSVISAIIITWDIIFYHRQKMKIMNVVWPLTALYGSIPAVVVYYVIGRNGTHAHSGTDQAISWKHVVKSTLHCGSGCTLGDLIAETFTVFVPVVILGNPVFGTWLIDYIAAFITGIVFQYAAIKSMRQMTFSEAVLHALKADSLSLSCWQVGMYGWMAIVLFVIYKHPLPKDSPVFWFMMQIAMLIGFATSYPVNIWLLKKKIKMPM